MFRFSFSAEIHHLTGLGLILWVVWAIMSDRLVFSERVDAWAVLGIGCVMVAPEIVQVLVKAWKTWKDNDA